MASANEIDIISELQKKPFSVRQSGEQNILVKQRPIPNLQASTGNRSFQESWYSKKDWLCGSSEKKALFCWPCLLFRPGSSSSWTQTGFKNMKNFLSDSIREEIQRHNEEVRQNREMLKTITEAVLYLSRQELAFRGHDESSGSMNRGNYRELIESFANLDSVFERRLHGRLAETHLAGGGRFTGVSPDIQNDLIDCLDKIIEDGTLKEIDCCTFLSVQVDEATDVSTSCHQCLAFQL
uniref:zinc finger MYM-type protein 1-like n=1 Tax=Xenia sp. Carnegie-2017 TaxID=2897299 RepID=UPI001F03A0B4|nr:zinc finger MYM-type protein 1-like [Xenia sp. Carnegie-2017]